MSSIIKQIPFAHYVLSFYFYLLIRFGEAIGDFIIELCNKRVCPNVFNQKLVPKFSASGTRKCMVFVKRLHTNRKSQYLYFYNKPTDMSGVRAPTESDFKVYVLFLFRVINESDVHSSQPVVLNQGSLDKELSKGLLGWATKDPHRFAYGIQSETGENLLIVGDTTSTPSLVNGSSRSFRNVSDDSFSSEYVLCPAAKSTNKVSFSHQVFPNKFIGDLGFDFEVEPYQPETNKSSFSGILLTAFQKLAIAGVVGSVTTFGVPDIAAAMRRGDGSESTASDTFRILERIAPQQSVVNDLVAQQQLARDSGFMSEDDIRHAFGEAYVPPNEPQIGPAQTPAVESKSNTPRVAESKHNLSSEGGRLPNIPEGKESSPRELLRPQGDEKVDPNDSISVIPNEPDSPREPDPIVQVPDQGVGDGQQQGNNQTPGDLSEILGAHEAAEGAAARAEARVRAGISL